VEEPELHLTPAIHKPVGAVNRDVSQYDLKRMNELCQVKKIEQTKEGKDQREKENESKKQANPSGHATLAVAPAGQKNLSAQTSA
jgi:hypothetical protein